MGNPLSYRGANLTWNGRLLMSYEKDGTKYAYTYNADNLRTSKSKYVNNTLVSKETYIWSGDVLIATKKYDCTTVTSDENGNVYASGKGSAEITCTVTDEYGNVVTDTCEVEVKYSFGQWLIVILLFGWLWY